MGGMGQSRQQVEDVSGACCSGGGGAGKGRNSRRKLTEIRWRFIGTTADRPGGGQRIPTAIYLHHCGHKRGYFPRQASKNSLA